ncbi:MAG: hypothetical protein Q4E01_06965 [Actinomycetaceae bacterium]|nr:hypothetical protein [Actinomycetaceae bacterium]
MPTGKLLAVLALIAAVIVGAAFIVLHYVGQAAESCSQASERYTTAAEGYVVEEAAARSALNFFSDENSFGYAQSEEGAAQIAKLRDLLANKPADYSEGCSSGVGADALEEAAVALEQESAELHKMVADITVSALEFAAPVIGEQQAMASRAITDAVESAKANIAKADNHVGFGQVNGSLDLMMNAQRLVDSPPQLPEVPSTLSSLDDLRAASAALDQMSEIRSNAEHSASALKEAVDKYSVSYERQKAEEEQRRLKEEAERRANCNDVIVKASDCTNFAEIHYLSSNGWTLQTALEDANGAGCKVIQQDDNPCD